MSKTTLTIPDIGGAKDVDVIEIMVKEGDEISIDSPLLTLESDKASMEIPATKAGIVSKLLIKVGDKVSEGQAMLELELAENTTLSQDSSKSEQKVDEPKEEANLPPNKSTQVEEKSSIVTVFVPDIGTTALVDVIEVMVNVGDEIHKDTPMITLEGDKATMEIPSPFDGKVESIAVKIGDKVGQGQAILVMFAMQDDDTRTNGSNTSNAKAPLNSESKHSTQQTISPNNLTVTTNTDSAVNTFSVNNSSTFAYASPGVRRYARELGVDLAKVKGNGRKGRITREDVNAFVKHSLSSPQSGGFSLPKAPAIDFSKFGPIEIKPLNKIKKLTGQYTHNAWLTIPHVTQFDEADITALEAFRKEESPNLEKEGTKLTLLAFVVKAIAKALSVYPQFNASLDETGENLIYKSYCHVGIAVDTPNGLVVPVIRDVDKLTITDIAKEMARLSKKAREKGLMPQEMSGGCFTISSLGGIGGTAFTPIVNAPEVAILGLSRSSMKPIFENGIFVPRLMLPLSLSYDHRVIDGAEAARFTGFLRDALQDVRRILL